jgi:hypothetical protein
MKALKLRTVGVRHVVSDGKDDLGEIAEAHLRSYVAGLPGSYEIPKPQAQTGFNTNYARERFADRVETRTAALMRADSTVSKLEAHRLAISQIAKEDSILLAAYRADIKEI